MLISWQGFYDLALKAWLSPLVGAARFCHAQLMDSSLIPPLNLKHPSHVYEHLASTRFNPFFDLFQFPMKIYALDGSVIAVNQACKNLSVSYSLAIEVIQKAAKGETIQIPVFWSEPRWFEASVSPLKDEFGNIIEVMMVLKDVTETIETQNALIKSISDRIESEADQKFLSQASELLNCSLDYKEILKTVSEHAMNYFCDGVFIDQLMPEGEIKRLMVVHKKSEVVKKFMGMDQKFPNRYDNNPVMRTLITGKMLFIENADVFWKKNRSDLDEAYIKEIAELGIKSSIRARLKGRESILGMMTFFVLKDSTKVLSRRHLWLAEELAYRASMAMENAMILQASQDAIKARDEFLSIASHELKTPLQSLTLQNQMRKRNLDKKISSAFGPEKISNMIDADLRHLMRINRLIDDMLDISRIRAGKLTFMNEKIEFCSFVKDVLDRFRPQLESVGCYLTAIFTEPIYTDIDIYRTEQVIVNLLTNAMKYGAGQPVKVEILKKQNRIQLQVHDKGPGIREQDQERIFDRFERAISSNEVSGLGLGLYISRQIMEQNQGSLFVRSVFGQGSTFILELPMDLREEGL